MQIPRRPPLEIITTELWVSERLSEAYVCHAMYEAYVWGLPGK
jgi:hypothetical protein